MNFKRTNIRKVLNEVFDADVDSLHKELVDMAKKWDGKVYLVGGAVRDELLGKDPKDLDYVVTGIDKDTLEKELLKTLPGSSVDQVGKSFGVVLVNLGNDQLEFALPRVDVDRENVTPDPDLPIEKDLLRRDLTINALAKDLETGEIHQPEGINALSDIKNKIIRSVGDPKERFEEDGLRILRAIRFASRMGFDIEPNTLRGIKVNLDKLQGVSADRFKGEFINAWTKGLRDTKKFFELLGETGIGDLMFGKDFDPIPLNLDGLEPDIAFRLQNIAAFLNGGNYEAMNVKLDDQNDVLAGRLFKDIVKTGKVSPEQSKALVKFIDRLPLIMEIFGEINPGMQDTLKMIFSKPAMKFAAKSDSEWEPWMLPLKGGEIIQVANEDGVILKGKAISEAETSLIQAFQDNEVQLGSNFEESKQVAIDYLRDNILKSSKSVQEAIRLCEVQDRIKNILEN